MRPHLLKDDRKICSSDFIDDTLNCIGVAADIKAQDSESVGGGILGLIMAAPVSTKSRKGSSPPVTDTAGKSVNDNANSRDTRGSSYSGGFNDGGGFGGGGASGGS